MDIDQIKYIKKLASFDLIHSHDLMRIDKPYTKHLPNGVKDLWIVLASGNKDTQVVLATHDAEAVIFVCHTYKLSA